MGILYIEGKCEFNPNDSKKTQNGLDDVQYGFEKAFGGNVSFETLTVDAPNNQKNTKIFCMQINIHGLTDMDNPRLRTEVGRLLTHLQKHNDP